LVHILETAMVAILIYLISAAVMIGIVYTCTGCVWLAWVLAAAALVGSLGVGACIGAAKAQS
jgi:hypothetical protein